MKKRNVFLIVILGLSILSCTKESINPPPPSPIINDTVDTVNSVPNNGNFIEIGTGSYYHQPKVVIRTGCIIYRPEYILIDTVDNDGYQDWGLYYNGQWYESYLDTFEEWTIIDTITSGDNYYIPRITYNVDSCTSEQYVKITYLDNQYQYQNVMTFKVFDNFIEVDHTTSGQYLYWMSDNGREQIHIGIE